ncbi:MAG: T9SS type A sorting domain-containing protein [Polaribacter sp.]|uniref:T9SS type A sorting domain-containing protein n=1 Tax=Polaribacter sp. TaxID=1920175 RepID=UPI003BB1E27C
MKKLKKIILIIGICLFNQTIIAQDNYGEQIIEQPVQGASHHFGNSVSIDGNYAVVGAPNENEQTGAANVFKKDENGNWVHIQKITAFVGQSIDEYFGTTVHIQGNYIFVSAPTDRLNEAQFQNPAGSVMIYKNDGNDNFVGIQRIRSSDISTGDYFGDSIDSYGDYLVVGAPHEDHDLAGNNTFASAGSAYVFKKDAVNDEWNQIQKLVPSHREVSDVSGISLAISENYIILGSNNNTDVDNLNPLIGSGSVFVFKKDDVNDVWLETQKLKGSNNQYTSFGRFGIDINGDYIAVGAPGEDSVYIFKVNQVDGVWSQIQKVNAVGFSTSSFGKSIALNGDFFIASAPSASVQQPNGTNIVSGTAFIFKNNNDTWNQVGQIAPSDGELNDFYGGGDSSFTFYSNSVIDFDGIHFIVGAGFNDVTNGGNTFVNAGKAYISGNFTGLFNQIFTWTGAISTDWNTAGNWDVNAVPTASDDVILADVVNAPKVNFNQSYVVNNLTINENLTIKTNASLTVNGNLDHGANIQVESFANGNGSFILRGNQTNLNPADLIYLRYVSGNNWHMLSSPVTNFDIDVFAAATALAEGQGNNRGIGFYNNNTNPRWIYYQDGADDTGDFIEGKGYSIQTSENAFLNFTGKLKATDLNNYVITENLDGWNLVGNPYPAFINANTNADENENFLTENADNLDPEFANIYVWNPNTTSYEPIGNGLGAKYIAPAQGFFVKSKVSGGTIDINKSMLTHQQGDLFLKTNPTKKMVLQIKDDTNISETTIAFKNGMTKGLDVTYDAAVFSGATNNLSIYTHLLEDNKNVPFAIQFLPELENNDFIIPLGVYQKEETEITLSLKEIDISDDIKIYLEDKTDNTFTEITNDNYQFSHQKEDSETGRFFLHFQQKSLNVDDVANSKIQIYKSDDSTITVLGIPKGTLNIYDITGKEVMKNREINNLKEQIQIPKLSKGVYLFKVKIGLQQVVKKLIF